MHVPGLFTLQLVLFVFFRKGITFVAVHDCFWTHACTVDEMNKVINITADTTLELLNAKC